jgi:nicotinamide-nucleotide amidase
MQASELIQLLKAQQLTLAVGESLTGGLLLSELISIPGASDVVLGGIVSYSTQSKIDQLGVRPATIELHGAVSEQTATEMALGARIKFKADLAVATTGVAGPELQEGKPAGSVFIAIAKASGTKAAEFRFTGDRNQIRSASVAAAMAFLGKHSGS